MRRAFGIGLVICLLAGAPAGCAGGTGQAARSQTALPPTAAAPSPGGGDAGDALTPSEAATTTTADLTDAGVSPGARLAEAPPAAAAATTTKEAVRTPHEHDPGRGPADIRAIVIAHRDEARACYDRALPDHPDMDGDLVMTWTIDPKGKVVRTAVDASRSTIMEPGVVDCISGIIKGIQFATSPGGFETRASYPFNFHPRRVKSSSP